MCQGGSREDDETPDWFVPGDWLAKEHRADYNGEDGRQVGDGARDGAAGLVDDVEIQHVGDSRAEDAEADHGVHRGCGDMSLYVPCEDGKRQELHRATEHLTGCEGDRAFGEVGQMASRVGKPDAVADDSSEAGAHTEQFSGAEAVPDPDNDEDAGESQDESTDAFGVRLVFAEDGDDHEQNRDGC